MNKRNLLIAIPALCSGYLHGQTQPASPNVIYILMDDLGYGDIGCFGQDKIETPHIDRLCSEGIKLTQHYSGSPVSAPARCVLMTGMHSGHAQIRFNNELAERGAGIYHRMFRQVGTGISGFRRNSQQTGIRPILRIQLPAPVAHILSSFSV